MRKPIRLAVLLAVLVGCAVAVEQSTGVLSASVSDGPGGRQSLDELLLFQPSPYPDGIWEPAGLNVEDVWLELDDGTRIHAWYCPHPDPVATILYLHGNAGNLSHRAHVLRRLHAEVGAATLIVDYPGYGRSEGKPTVATALAAARVARARLAKLSGIPESDIVLMGRSLGGALAVELAAESPPRALILESTFSSMRAVADLHYPALSWLVPKDKLNAAARIAEVRAPLFQSHGDADQIIPIALGRELHDAAREPKRFLALRGRGHNDGLPSDGYGRLADYLAALP